MSYDFNPHCHVKIWLSEDGNFLNLENRSRLIEMRDINPKDIIYFIYDSRLLSEKALKELESFCTRYNIISKDVQKDVIPDCHTEEEKKLIEIYNDEISHLNEGGNLAVGSDILRWVKPVYKLGSYTDFDVKVDTRMLPEIISVEKPLLLNLGSVAVKGDVESLIINNDIVAVVDSEQALSDIQKIQTAIYTYCSKQSTTENVIHKRRTKLGEELGELLSPFVAEMMLAIDLHEQSVSLLASLISGKTAREVRQHIIAVTADNLCYSKSILSQNKQSVTHLSDAAIITKATSLIRAATKEKLGWVYWLLLPKNQYKSIQALDSIQDDDTFLTQARAEYRKEMLQNGVAYTSGSFALTSVFDKYFYKKDTINNEVALFSLTRYALDKAFISGCSFSLHANPRTVAARVCMKEAGIFSDLSWLQEGKAARARREQQIIKEQEHLPQYFHDMREKMEGHIKKIQTDLKGFFGFYRYRERHAKIDALQKIMGHFNEQSFDIKAFDAALNSYRTKDVSASIGKSKTKELIDDLEGFSRHAKYYMMDENGKVEILPPQPAYSKKNN